MEIENASSQLWPKGRGIFFTIISFLGYKGNNATLWQRACFFYSMMNRMTVRRGRYFHYTSGYRGGTPLFWLMRFFFIRNNRRGGGDVEKSNENWKICHFYEQKVPASGYFSPHFRHVLRVISGARVRGDCEYGLFFATVRIGNWIFQLGNGRGHVNVRMMWGKTTFYIDIRDAKRLEYQ